MTDYLTTEERSRKMGRIPSQNTKPELIIRSLLHRAGFRFKVGESQLPGSPDIVLPKYRTAIFVHGCFWHRHQNCPKATTPSSNREYWQKKFDRNVARDAEVAEELKRLQWQNIVLWECEILKDPLAVFEAVVKRMEGECHREYDLELDRGQILKLAEKKSSQYLNDRAGHHEK